MKRIIIIAILLCFCIGASLYTLYQVNHINDTVDQYVNQSLDALTRADEEELKMHLEDLSQFWHEAEDRLIHFVRHTQIEDITKSVSRLQALASGEDYSELAAELASIRWQIEHINRSEQISLQNLL